MQLAQERMSIDRAPYSLGAQPQLVAEFFGHRLGLAKNRHREKAWLRLLAGPRLNSKIKLCSPFGVKVLAPG